MHQCTHRPLCKMHASSAARSFLCNLSGFTRTAYMKVKWKCPSVPVINTIQTTETGTFHLISHESSMIFNTLNYTTVNYTVHDISSYFTAHLIAACWQVQSEVCTSLMNEREMSKMSKTSGKAYRILEVKHSRYCRRSEGWLCCGQTLSHDCTCKALCFCLWSEGFSVSHASPGLST